MKLIDTHSHLYSEEFDKDRETLIQIAKESGITALLLPNVDLITVDRMHELCDRHAEFAYPMMGLHPTSVNAGYAEDLRKTEAYLEKRPYCAIGEIGIDLYWDKTYLKEQKLAFEEQLRWSIDLDLPVAIHTRNAQEEVLDSIYKVGNEKLKGVFHSFTGSEADLEELLKLTNFMIGINGVITFKNSSLSETIKKAGIDRIVLETDAPYLSPVPYRGKRNEPHYIWKTAEQIALALAVPLEKVVENTRLNAINLFKISDKYI